jgi:hypothetical protein
LEIRRRGLAGGAAALAAPTVTPPAQSLFAPPQAKAPEPAEEDKPVAEPESKDDQPSARGA